MPVRLQYNLTGPGWADCLVEINGQRAKVTASYLSDALHDLCCATAAILKGGTSSEAVFEEEPGAYRWLFDRVSATSLRVRILDDVIAARNRGGTAILDAECHPAELGDALASELARLLAELGEEGYLAQWVEYPFPRAAFEELKVLLGRGSADGHRAPAFDER